MEKEKKELTLLEELACRFVDAFEDAVEKMPDLGSDSGFASEFLKSVHYIGDSIAHLATAPLMGISMEDLPTLDVEIAGSYVQDGLDRVADKIGLMTEKMKGGI